jgi:hypothetical protein
MKKIVQILITFFFSFTAINSFAQHSLWVELTPSNMGSSQEIYQWLQQLKKEHIDSNSTCYYAVATAMSGEPRVAINWYSSTFENPNCITASKKLTSGADRLIKSVNRARWGYNQALSNPRQDDGTWPEAVKTLHYKTNNMGIFTETMTQIVEAMKATNPDMNWTTLNSISGQPLTDVFWYQVVEKLSDLDAMPQVNVPGMLAEHFGQEMATEIWNRHFSTIDEITFHHWRTMPEVSYIPEQ